MADVCAMRFENCDEESQDSRDSQRQGAPDGDKSAEAGRDEDEPPPPPVPLARPPFECHSPCPLLPSRYVERIMKYTQCSPCTLVVAIVYLQRLKDREASGPSAAGAGCQPLRLTSFNIQRMFLTAMMIAHKFLDEPVCSNKQWSLVGDLTVKDMNNLELHMLWSQCGRCNSTAMSPAPSTTRARPRSGRSTLACPSTAHRHWPCSPARPAPRRRSPSPLDGVLVESSAVPCT